MASQDATPQSTAQIHESKHHCSSNSIDSLQVIGNNIGDILTKWNN